MNGTTFIRNRLTKSLSSIENKLTKNEQMLFMADSITRVGVGVKRGNHSTSEEVGEREGASNSLPPGPMSSRSHTSQHPHPEDQASNT